MVSSTKYSQRLQSAGLILPESTCLPVIETAQPDTVPEDCLIFQLPSVQLTDDAFVTDERASIAIRVDAQLLTGYTGEYAINIDSDQTGLMTIGRRKESDSNAEYTEIRIRPDSNWLNPGEIFRVFRIALGEWMHVIIQRPGKTVFN